MLFYGQPFLGGSRHGVDIPRQPLARWVIQSGEQLQPLLNLMRDKLLDYPVLHCDETRLQVLHEPVRAPSAQSWMWVQKQWAGFGWTDQASASGGVSSSSERSQASLSPGLRSTPLSVG